MKKRAKADGCSQGVTSTGRQTESTGHSFNKWLLAIAMAVVLAIGQCPAVAFAASESLHAGAVQTQFDAHTEEGDLPFHLEETTDGVVDGDVVAQKLTLLGSNAQVVGYDASQGSGYLLIKENKNRDGYFHLYLVGKQGVAHEFQNTSESVIDAIVIEKCWSGGAKDGLGTRIAAVNHMDGYQSLYAIKTPSGVYDVYNADTGEYFAHQLDSKPTIPGYGLAWRQAGVSSATKGGLVGLLKADGSYLYAPMFKTVGYNDNKVGKAKMPDGTYALITTYGYGVSKDGTKLLQSWEALDVPEDGLYAEASRQGGSNVIIRLSDGKEFPEPNYASIAKHSDSGGTYSGGSGEDWAISHDELYDPDTDVYTYTAKVYNEAYPNGFDVAGSYFDLWNLNIYKGHPAGYVVEWKKKGERYEHDGVSRNLEHTTLYNEQMEVVAEADDGVPDAYTWEETSAYDQPCGCYGKLLFFKNTGKKQAVTVKGPNGVILKNIVDLKQNVKAYGDKVVVRAEDGTCSVIDSNTGERKFAFYTDDLEAYGGMFIRYWLDKDFNPNTDNFGLINLKTNTNSGLKYAGINERMFWDDEANFAMIEVAEPAGGAASADSGSDAGDDEGEGFEDGDFSAQASVGKWYWVDGNFNEIADLGDADLSDITGNSEMLVDAATKSVLVFKGERVDRSQAYELFSYASGSLKKVADYSVDTPRLWRYNGAYWTSEMQSDYALAVSERIDVGEYRHGLISRDGNILVEPAYEDFEAPGRNLFAFSTSEDAFTGGTTYVHMSFYDHTGAPLAQFTIPYVKGLDLTSDNDLVRTRATQSACPFGGDLTAVYRSAEDANAYYFYDFSEVNNAAVSGHVRVTEEMLYTTDEYSDLLFNSAYNKRSLRVRGALMDQIIASNTNAKYALSYAKAMMKGWTKSLETAWKDRAWQSSEFNGTERELYEELAQELVEAIMKSNGDAVFTGGGLYFDTAKDALDSFDGYFKDYKRVAKIYKYVDTDTETIRQYSKFLEKIMTPSWEKPGNDRRYEFYQSLQKKDFWDKLGNVEAALGTGMDVLDAVTTYACICRLNAEIVHSIAQYVPADSGLHYGLTSLATKISNPTASMVVDFVKSQLNGALVDFVSEQGIQEAMKGMLGLSSSALGGYIAIGSLFYYVISENIDTATLSDRLKAEFAVHNATTLDTAMGTYRDYIIAQNDAGKSVNFKEAKKRYTLLFTAFNASLEQAVEALDKVVEADGGTPSNCAYRGTYDANKSALTYPAYIRSCRGCAEAVWEAQVASGKATVTKYVPGRSASSFGGSYSIDVPEQVTVDGASYPVTAIASGALAGVAVEEVYVPSSVTSIDANAFGEDAGKISVVGEPSQAIEDFANANKDVKVEVAQKTVVDGGLAIASAQPIAVSFDPKTGKLTADGLKLQITYSDGSTEVVTEGYTIEPKDTKTVIVSYGGVSVTVAVTSNSAIGRPITVRYVDGQGVDLAPADVYYVKYGDKSFTLPSLPSIEGYQPTSTSLTIDVEDAKSEYLVVFASTASAVVKGDVTGDGMVAMNDILKINSYLLKRIQLSDAELAAADVTGDGVVAMNDILKINSYLLKRIPSL